MMGSEIIVRVDWMFSKEKFSGEQCSACGDCIYGDGFRMVMVTRTGKESLPNFSETKVILCSSCKAAMK